MTAVVDEGGAEARRFHAETPGQTVVYDAAGRLVFDGGITVARGHVGDNAGEARLAALLAGHEADRRDAPVFGCPLSDPSRNDR